MTRRDGKLDILLGKRVKIFFKDGDLYTGKLTWDSNMQSYMLNNCVNEKKGFMVGDVYFKKSHIKKMEVLR